MKIVDLDLKMSSINQRYGFNPKTGKLFNNSEYKQFKEALKQDMAQRHVKPVESPYYVDIYMETYVDIDAPIKAILDAMESYGVIDNDKNVLQLSVQKRQIGKGKKSKLQIVVDTLCTCDDDCI